MCRQTKVLATILLLSVLAFSLRQSTPPAQAWTPTQVWATAAVQSDPTAAASNTATHSIYLAFVTGSAPEPAIIPETTVVLSPQTTTALSGISSNGSTFEFAGQPPELAEVDPGDVIVGVHDVLAPGGFLRRVTAVTTTAQGTILLTEQATLEDAIQDGSFHIEETLTPDEITSITLVPGVALVPSSRTDDGLQNQFVFEFKNAVLFDKDGNPDNNDFQVEANGKVTFTQHFEFDVDIDFWKLETVEFISTSDVTHELEWESTLSDTITEDIEFGKISFGRRVIPVAGFPVYYEPILSLIITPSGTFKTGVKTGVSYSTTVESGLRYAGGQWQEIGSASNDFTYTPPSLVAGYEAEVAAGPELFLRLYETVGPKAKLQVYGRLEIDLVADPVVILYGGLRARVGIKVDVLSRVWVDIERTVIDIRRVLLELDHFGEPYEPRAPSPPDGSTGNSLDTILSWTGGDPNPLDSVTYKVALEAGDSTPESLVCDGTPSQFCDPPTQLNPGTLYFWKVTAQDEDGNVTVGPIWRFTTGTSANQPPFQPSNPSPANNASGVGAAVTLAWSGGDPDNDPVTYDVFLEAGDNSPDNLICDDTGNTSCSPAPLALNTTYYWRVDARDSNGATAATTWQFTTGSGTNQPPLLPSSPVPANNTSNVNPAVTLSWIGGDPNGDVVTFKVYLDAGDNTPDQLVCDNITTISCNPGPLNFGQTYYWQVIATDTPGASTPGPVWHFTTGQDPGPVKTLDVALIIDSSGSMVTNDPNDLRKDAAKVFIDAMISGDQIAVIDFDDNTYVAWALQLLTADRSGPKAAVDTINSSGGTNIGAGLQVGFNELNSSSNSNPKAAVLLTDGQGSYSNQADLYAAEGWPVFTIGLSDEADENLLQAIANQTGGKYYALTDPGQLLNVYFAIQSAISGAQEVLNTSLVMEQGDTELLTAAIDANQNAANFVTNWPGSEVNTQLTDPSGRLITPDTALTDPNVYHAKGDTYEVYRISYPVAGQWQVELYGADLAPGGEQVTLQVSQRDNELPVQDWAEVSAGSASGGGISNNGGDSERPSLVIAPDGSIYVAWNDKSNGNSEIYVRRWNGNTWVEVGTDSASGGGISNTAAESVAPYLAIAPDDTVYVTWQEEGSSDTEVYVRRWNGSAWVEVGTGSASGGGVSNDNDDSTWPIIAVAPDSTPYLTWGSTTDADNEVYVLRWNGSAWGEVGTGSASGGGISNNSGDSGRPSIAITPNGTPYVGWTDATSGDTEIYVRRWNGNNWVEPAAGSASGGGISNNNGASRPPVLTADPNGLVYAAWPDDSGGNFEIYVKRWNGSFWEVIGSTSASEGGVSNTPGNSIAPLAAAGPDGVPYITWYEGGTANSEVYVRRWNGNDWVEVGSHSATAGGISDTPGASVHSTMFIAADSVPYIAWSDNSSGDYEIYIKSGQRP